MKTKLCLLASVLLGICSCSTPRTSGPSVGGQCFRLVLVRPASDSGWAVRLPIQLDGKDVAKLKNGGYTEMTLPPGNYTLASRRGAVLGHDFPPATTTIKGIAGERKVFSYVMEYAPKVGSYPVAPGVDMKDVTAQPYKAEWQEMTPEDFQKNYLEAKLQ